MTSLFQILFILSALYGIIVTLAYRDSKADLQDYKNLYKVHIDEAIRERQRHLERISELDSAYQKELEALRKEPVKTQTQELKDFLMDLQTGVAILAVGRVDQDNLLLRSPKRS